MNPSFVDYLMPTINMMPRLETTLVHGYPGVGPLRRQKRRRNRPRPADGRHRQRDLQRHRRAYQNIAAQSGKRAKGVEGGGEGLDQAIGATKPSSQL